MADVSTDLETGVVPSPRTVASSSRAPTKKRQRIKVRRRPSQIADIGAFRSETRDWIQARGKEREEAVRIRREERPKSAPKTALERTLTSATHLEAEGIIAELEKRLQQNPNNQAAKEALEQWRTHQSDEQSK